MACINPPIPTLPTLPSPLSLAPPALPPITTPGLCCQLLPPLTLLPPITLPPNTLNPAVIATINAALQQVQDYLDSIVPDCPRSS